MARSNGRKGRSLALKDVEVQLRFESLFDFCDIVAFKWNVILSWFGTANWRTPLLGKPATVFLSGMDIKGCFATRLVTILFPSQPFLFTCYYCTLQVSPDTIQNEVSHLRKNP